MSEQLNKLAEVTTDLIQRSIQTLEKGGTFLSEQIPEVIQQLLLWKMVESGLYTVAGVVLFIVTILATVQQFKFWKAIPIEGQFLYTSYDKNVSRIQGGYGILSLISAGVLLVTYGFCTLLIDLTWLKIWIAPKFYLIEYAATLIRK